MCACCSHDSRAEIDRLLVKQGGKKQGAISRRFSIHRKAVSRHWRLHVLPSMKAELEKPEKGPARPAIDALDELADVAVAMRDTMNDAVASRHGAATLLAGRERTRTLETIGRLQALLGEVGLDPEVRQVLREHPVSAEELRTALERQAAPPPVLEDVLGKARQLLDECGWTVLPPQGPPAMGKRAAWALGRRLGGWSLTGEWLSGEELDAEVTRVWGDLRARPEDGNEALAHRLSSPEAWVERSGFESGKDEEESWENGQTLLSE